MSCARGCCATQTEHYRSLSVGRSTAARTDMTKTTTHRGTVDGQGVTVDVTEHWHDRQDVTVKPDTIRIKAADLSGRLAPRTRGRDVTQ